MKHLNTLREKFRIFYFHVSRVYMYTRVLKSLPLAKRNVTDL